MGYYDARSELYEEIEIFGQRAYFTSLRIDKKTIPDGLFRYEIREESGEPCQISTSIFVNHYGTILTHYPIELDEYGYCDLDEDDINWLCKSDITLEEIVKGL